MMCGKFHLSCTQWLSCHTISPKLLAKLKSWGLEAIHLLQPFHSSILKKLAIFHNYQQGQILQKNTTEYPMMLIAVEDCWFCKIFWKKGSQNVSHPTLVTLCNMHQLQLTAYSSKQSILMFILASLFLMCWASIVVYLAKCGRTKYFLEDTNT